MWSICQAPIAWHHVHRMKWWRWTCYWDGEMRLHAPDVILCIVDASNLQRNLYLVSQVLELDLPTVIALNMIDVAEAQGDTIEIERLSVRNWPFQ